MTEQRPDEGTQSVEYLGDEPEQAGTPERRSRPGRKALVGLTVGALLAAGAAGAFAVAQFLDGGPSAASAAPSNVLGFISVDLDPAGDQKVAAYRTLKKFPALDDQLGLTSQDDLRRWVFKGLTSDSGCDEVDFDSVDPWLGNALGLGVVPGEEEPTVFFALEVTDQDKARPGVRDLASCLGEDQVGTAFTGDFMIVAETAAQAEDVARSAEESPLADDPTYQVRTGQAGDDGVVTGYLAPSFGDFMSEQLTNMGGMFGGPVQYEQEAEPAVAAGRAGALAEDTSDPGFEEWGEDGSGAPPVDPFLMGFGPGMMLGGLGGLGDLEALGEQLADFGGAAMQVRFADESLEIELSSKGLDGQMADGGTVDLGDLPADTGLALGAATGQEWADRLVEGLRKTDPRGFDRSMEEGSRETGLSLPEDLSTLVGDSVTVAFDAGVDLPRLFESFFFGDDPTSGLKVGLRIAGDAGQIAPLVEKLAAYASEEDGPQVVWAEGDGAVAVGFDQTYVDALAAGGDLRSSAAFERAVTEEEVVAGLFADFDADSWLDRAMEDSSKEERANVEPLSAVGVTATRDGDTFHATLRLTTD